jgi:hypothetical protein
VHSPQLAACFRSAALLPNTPQQAAGYWWKQNHKSAASCGEYIPKGIKKVKLHAAEQEMKDYQVIRNALLLYFQKLK